MCVAEIKLSCWHFLRMIQANKSIYCCYYRESSTENQVPLVTSTEFQVSVKSEKDKCFRSSCSESLLKLYDVFFVSLYGNIRHVVHIFFFFLFFQNWHIWCFWNLWVLCVWTNFVCKDWVCNDQPIKKTKKTAITYSRLHSLTFIFHQVLRRLWLKAHDAHPQSLAHLKLSLPQPLTLSLSPSASHPSLTLFTLTQLIEHDASEVYTISNSLEQTLHPVSKSVDCTVKKRKKRICVSLSLLTSIFCLLLNQTKPKMNLSC